MCQTEKNNTNIPKSGWLKSIKEIKQNKPTFKIKKNLSLLYLPVAKNLKL